MKAGVTVTLGQGGFSAALGSRTHLAESGERKASPGPRWELPLAPGKDAQGSLRSSPEQGQRPVII